MIDTNFYSDNHVNPVKNENSYHHLKTTYCCIFPFRISNNTCLLLVLFLTGHLNSSALLTGLRSTCTINVTCLIPAYIGYRFILVSNNDITLLQASSRSSEIS